MRWQELQPEIEARLQSINLVAGNRPILLVDIARQRLFRVGADASGSCSYPVSTAARGPGNTVDSYQTPTGLHRIRDKIGSGQPPGMVFESRMPTGRVSRDLDIRDKDEITSRILWLDGLETGVNRNGECDTYSRYIYIHGTTDEQRIGQPVSAGCIRMRNDDVIELFDEVEVDDVVLIR